MAQKNNTKVKKGFTIIEVVLVLAIAGLIFLMVFVAFPSLQRGQRDTQRRDDMARFSSQLAQYQSNNYGKVPGSGDSDAKKAENWNDFIERYLRSNGDTFADPSGANYHVMDKAHYSDDANAEGTAITVCTSSACDQASKDGDTARGIIRIYTNATCSGEKPEYKQGSKYIAFTYKLEGAGIYCGHN